MKDWSRKKLWIVIAVCSVIVISFVFNENFRRTLARKRALRETQQELVVVTEEVNKMRAKIASLENNSQTEETMVRKDLGYLRPGEKEVRFLNKSSTKKAH